MLIFSLILLQLCVFSGLIFVFRKITTQNVASATKHLEELNEDYRVRESQVKQQLEEAKQKSAELIAQARDEAEKSKAQIIKEAESYREKIMKQTRVQSEELIQQADKSRQMLISELEKRIEKEAINKACELIHDSLPEQFKQEVHAHWIEDLIKGGFSELDNLHVPEEINEVKIASAFALKEQQRTNLSKRLKQLLGRDITLKAQTDSQLVVGVVVTLGSLVLDGSLRNKIRHQASTIDARSSE